MKMAWHTDGFYLAGKVKEIRAFLALAASDSPSNLRLWLWKQQNRPSLFVRERGYLIGISGKETSSILSEKT
jgi:hypothetical protein